MRFPILCVSGHNALEADSAVVKPTAHDLASIGTKLAAYSI
jgi:hypothetical protein